MISDKIKKLYDEIQGQNTRSMKERRLISILNEIVVNGSTDLFEISKVVGVTETTIIQYLKNKDLMLSLFSEKEYNEVLNCISVIPDTPGYYFELDKKPVLERIAAFAKDVELLSRFNYGHKKLILMLNELLVKKVKTLGIAASNLGFSMDMMLRYLKDKELILSAFNEIEYFEINGMIDAILNEEKNNDEKFDKAAIQEIMQSRYILSEVAEMYHMNLNKLYRLIQDEEFLKKNFDLTTEQVMGRINETSLICRKMPRTNDYKVVKDKTAISIVKEDVFYLRSSVMTRLETLVKYLNSSCNMDQVCKELDTNLNVVLASLTDPGLRSVLRDDFLEKYDRIIGIEKVLSTGMKVDQVELANNIVQIIKDKYDGDVDKIQGILNIPLGLLKRVIAKGNIKFEFEPKEEQTAPQAKM